MSLSSLEARKAFLRNISCIICKSFYDSNDHQPADLSCGHTFCVRCIDLMRLLHKRSCPECGQMIRPKAFANHELMTMVLANERRNMWQNLSFDRHLRNKLDLFTVNQSLGFDANVIYDEPNRSPNKSLVSVSFLTIQILHFE